MIVVNPTHYAVALRYDDKNMRAPTVVAKGVDLMAARIREVASEHRIPIFEAPPLARALHRSVEIGDEIPTGLYVAVAQVLTYIFQLRTAMRDHLSPPPLPTIDIAGSLRAWQQVTRFQSHGHDEERHRRADRRARHPHDDRAADAAAGARPAVHLQHRAVAGGADGRVLRGAAARLRRVPERAADGDPAAPRAERGLHARGADARPHRHRLRPAR